MRYLLLLIAILLPFQSFAANTASTDVELSSSQSWSITDASQTGLDLAGNFTIAAWVNLESLPSGDCFGIVSKTNDGVGGSYVFRICDDTVDPLQVYTIGNAGQDVEQVSWGPSTATTYHVAVTFNTSGSAYKFYVNGSQFGTTQTGANTSITNTAQPFHIGSSVISGVPARFFDGLIDDVRVWSRELSSTEISDLYNTPCSFSNGSNLQGSWAFESNGNDSSGNGNNLTNNNSATFGTALYSCPASSTLSPHVVSQGDVMMSGDILSQ